jgi:hypothetical protein
MFQHTLQKIQLIFARGKAPASYAIRVRYQSRWSHVGVIKNGMVHEACHPQGVIETPLEEFKKRYGDGRWEIANAYAEPGWELRADSLLGLRYDWWGAAGIGFGTRKLDDPDALWCSHHVGIILGTLRPERLNRLAPEHIWIVSQPLAWEL